MTEFKGLDAKMIEFLRSKACLPVTQYEKVPRIPTGSLELDWATGGGFPRGRFTVLTGDPDVGKSTTMLLCAVQTIKNDGIVAYFDMEAKLDTVWARTLGLTPEYFHLYQPKTGEMLMDMITEFLKADVYDLIVVDSIAAVAFAADLEATAGQVLVGVAARKWSEFFRVNTLRIALTHTAMVSINQLTFAVGSFNPTGQPTAEYGGRAAKYFAALRLKLKKTAPSKPGRLDFKGTVIKNSTGPTKGYDFEYQLITNQGAPFVNPFVEAARVGKKVGAFTRQDGSLIKGNGSWFFAGEKVGGNERDVVNWLLDNPDKLEDVISVIHARIELANEAPVMIENVPDDAEETLVESEDDAAAESDF